MVIVWSRGLHCTLSKYGPIWSWYGVDAFIVRSPNMVQYGHCMETKKCPLYGVCLYGVFAGRRVTKWEGVAGAWAGVAVNDYSLPKISL
jgi:hypothetical protein